MGPFLGGIPNFETEICSLVCLCWIFETYPKWCTHHRYCASVFGQMNVKLSDVVAQKHQKWIPFLKNILKPAFSVSSGPGDLIFTCFKTSYNSPQQEVTALGFYNYFFLNPICSMYGIFTRPFPLECDHCSPNVCK